MNLKWACLQNWRCVQHCVSEKNAIQVTFLWSVSQEKTRHRTVPNMVSCWWKIPQWMFLLTDLSLLKYSRWKRKPLFVAILNKTPVFVIWIPLSPETLWTHNPSPDDGGIRCSFQGKRVNILPLPLSVISSYFECIKLGFTDILLYRFDTGSREDCDWSLHEFQKNKMKPRSNAAAEHSNGSLEFCGYVVFISLPSGLLSTGFPLGCSSIIKIFCCYLLVVIQSFTATRGRTSFEKVETFVWISVKSEFSFRNTLYCMRNMFCPK